jgi:two-component system OmpR family response regulator
MQQSGFGIQTRRSQGREIPPISFRAAPPATADAVAAMNAAGSAKRHAHRPPGNDIWTTTGFELARALRAARDLPIVFLTARDTVQDRLEGFELGADDYLVKPFALEELLARVRAVLRRTGRLGAAIEAGDVVVDEQAGLATRAGFPLELTATELRLLAYLLRQRGVVLSKHQLLTQVWGYDAYDPNVVEVHVSALRRKLERQGPRILETIRGLGYRLDPR